ncbi:MULTISPECIES: tripartite tricarboxylate transporter TctB family protein [unclassified Acidovorax]|uniref:tripartite tricarboxylate transporter TctB family protein n=1 Tax=unclassified Acidovorax TaxID=2684926 RepID=UPI002882D654|nr:MULTISPECIES: tripartite tricarboxylate transporter TctB family protein [unclassified Acidovorax]
MKIKSQKDFFAGLMFMSIGVAFAIGATNYTVGTGARMGPGYFPLILGILLSILGGAIVFYSTVVESADGDKVGKWAWKPLFFVLASNFAFGVLLAGLPTLGVPAMGLIVAIYALTFIASLAGDKFRPLEVFVLATFLAVGSYVAFVWALKLQFPVWPSFIVG